MKNITHHLIPSIFYDLIKFFKCDIAQGKILREKRIGKLHNFTMDVNPGYNYVEKIRGGVQWHMMGSKDFISSICFEL